MFLAQNNPEVHQELRFTGRDRLGGTGPVRTLQDVDPASLTTASAPSPTVRKVNNSKGERRRRFSPSGLGVVRIEQLERIGDVGDVDLHTDACGSLLEAGGLAHGMSVGAPTPTLPLTGRQPTFECETVKGLPTPPVRRASTDTPDEDRPFCRRRPR